MAINIPRDAGPKVSALADQLQLINRGVEYSDQELRDAACAPGRMRHASEHQLDERSAAVAQLSAN
jgi:hypothetical protein